MKKIYLILALVVTSGMLFNTQAQNDSIKTKDSKKTMKDMKKGETIFIEQADKCLAIIEQAAQKMSIKGVALVAFIPGEISTTWISKMKVVGALSNEKANYLAIVNTKAAEMADTYMNSGSGIREPKKGEFGYQGGVIKKVKYGYILAGFSGGTGVQDAEVASKGLEWLSNYYN